MWSPPRPSEPPASVGPADDPAAINGFYRADISAGYLESGGINHSEAFANGGIFDLTFKDGVFQHHLDRDGSVCIGTYTIRGPLVRVSCSFPNGGTHDPLFSATWNLQDDELRFTEVDRPEDLLGQLMWGGKPFTRLGDAP